MNNSDRIYKEMINDSIKKINERIADLEKKNKGIRAILGDFDEKIESLKVESNQLKNQLEELEQRIARRVEVNEVGEILLDIYDEKSENNVAKQEEIRQNIERLEALKGNLQTSRAKRKIAKKIEHQQNIIKRLQKKSVRIDKKQRVILFPKTRKEQKRNRLMSRQQGKVNVVTSKINDNNELQAMLNPESSIIDSMKSTIYDIKGAFYQRKLKHSKDVLETMQNSNTIIALRGANAITLSKKAANKFRQIQEAARSMDQENENTEDFDRVAVVR